MLLAAQYIEESDILIIGGHGGDGGYAEYACEVSGIKTVLVANTEKIKIPPSGEIDSAEAEILEEVTYYEIKLD